MSHQSDSSLRWYFLFAGIHVAQEAHVHAAGRFVQDLRPTRHGGRFPNPIRHLRVLVEYQGWRSRNKLNCGRHCKIYLRIYSKTNTTKNYIYHDEFFMVPSPNKIDWNGERPNWVFMDSIIMDCSDRWLQNCSINKLTFSTLNPEVKQRESHHLRNQDNWL